MVLADQWYSSGTFWTAAGTVAIIITAVGTMCVAWRLANPIRRLKYGMSVAPLLQRTSNEISSSLKITWNDKEVKHPHVLELSLISRGRQDIDRGDFDGQPLPFKVGAVILAVLQTYSSPGTFSNKDVEIQGDTLEVGPSLIGRRQAIKFTLLTDGEPTLSTPATALRNVQLEPSAEPSRHHLPVTAKFAAGVAATLAAVALILVWFLLHPASQADKLQVALADLESNSPTVQINGINSLQGIMKASPDDQPAAMQALCSFIRERSPSGNADNNVTYTIQAALTVLTNRNPSYDDGTTIDLDGANLTNAGLAGIDLSNANLSNSDLTTADLSGADLHNANLYNAYLGGAVLTNTNLSDAILTEASLYQTSMCTGAEKPIHTSEGYNCSANG
jgi:Pentapeptide repeats (8 copies)